MSTIQLQSDHETLTRKHRSLTGLLELILRRAELSPEAMSAVKRHYEEKTEQLKGCAWLRQYELIMSPQGSVSTGTTVAPLERKHGEHDVDLVLKVIAEKYAFTVAELHKRVGDRLRVDFSRIMYAIRFGWTLDYAEKERFHFDVVAAIPWTHAGIMMAAAADTKTNAWKPTNPDQYASDFLKLAEQLPFIEDRHHRHALNEEMVLANSARVTVEPLPENTVLKLPLQRGVQLSKRFRDVWFAHRKRLKERTPSIIITTMMWRAYERYVAGHTFPSMFSVFETLAAHLDDPQILQVIVGAHGQLRYILINPTVPDENLVERWNEPSRAQEAKDFLAWVKDFRAFLKALNSTEGLHRLRPLLTDSLGSGETVPVFREIAGELNPLTRSSSIYHLAGIGLATSGPISASPVRRHTFDGRHG